MPIALGLGLAACAVPVATGLSEEDANHVVLALEQSGIAASKLADPDTEARFQVRVGQSEASSAVSVLAQENLPPRASPGVLDTLGESGLVPSRSAEHARWVTGVAGDLERSLRALDGVLSARVHLAVPERDALSDLADAETEARLPSASVLIRHRGLKPPLATADVQRLVAGAVPGLSPGQVNVVTATAAAPARSAGRELARIGPITVTRSSLLALKLLIGALAVANLVLVTLLLALWSRVRRAENAPLGEPPPAEPA